MSISVTQHKLRGYEQSLSHSVFTSVRQAYQGPGPAFLSFDPISAILVRRMLANMAMALEKGPVISICMIACKDGAKSRVRRGDLQAFFPLPCAMCKTRAKKAGYYLEAGLSK